MGVPPGVNLFPLLWSGAVLFVLFTAALCVWAPWWIWCWPVTALGLVTLLCAIEFWPFRK